MKKTHLSKYVTHMFKYIILCGKFMGKNENTTFSYY